MFRTRNSTKSDEDNSKKLTVYSLINSAHIIAESTWAVSLVRKRGTEHAFLIVEGKKDDEYTIIRSDMFLDMSGKPFEQPTNAASSMINYFWGVSQQSSTGKGFIRLKELNMNELEALAEASEYQSWGINIEEAEKLLRHLSEERGKQYSYHIAGDSSLFSVSTSNSNTHNCVSWCQEILKKSLGFNVGNQWAIIKKPSEFVKQAILQAKEKATSASSSLGSKS